MVHANYIIFSLIYTVTTNFNTLSKREAARIAKYIVHTGNVKYIALSNKEMESIYQIVMYQDRTKWDSGLGCESSNNTHRDLKEHSQ